MKSDLATDTKLKELIQAHPFENQGAINLAEFLWNKLEENALDPLDSLVLSHRGITAKGVGSLCNVLFKGLRVSSIDLTGNPIGSIGVAALGKSLEVNKYISQLWVSNTDAGDEGALAIADAIVSPSSSLRVLDLRNNDITAAGARGFIRALQDNRKIKRLLIGGNHIPNNLVAELNQLIARNKKDAKRRRSEMPQVPRNELVAPTLGTANARRRTVMENQNQEATLAFPVQDNLEEIRRKSASMSGSNPMHGIASGTSTTSSASVRNNSLSTHHSFDSKAGGKDGDDFFNGNGSKGDFDDIFSDFPNKIEEWDGASSSGAASGGAKTARQQRTSLVEPPTAKKGIINRIRRWTLSGGGTNGIPELDDLQIEDAKRHCRGNMLEMNDFVWLLKRAKRGNLEAMFSLGYLYDVGGGGVAPNTEEAIHWYSEASRRGHAIAQNNVGVLNSTGHRGRRKIDNAEAVYWYKKSAEKGYVSGQFHLGLMYMSGSGFDKTDPALAFQWFKKAAKQGHPLAQSNVGAMYMNGKGIDINYKKSIKWLKKAASHGNAVAMHNLGVIFENGLGTSVDSDKAQMYLTKARSGTVDSPIPYDLSIRTVQDAGVLMNL